MPVRPNQINELRKELEIKEETNKIKALCEKFDKELAYGNRKFEVTCKENKTAKEFMNLNKEIRDKITKMYLDSGWNVKIISENQRIGWKSFGYNKEKFYLIFEEI